jgi:hypothetical protein
MADVAGHAMRAAVQLASRDDAGPDPGADLDEDEMPDGLGNRAELTQRHQVGVVIDKRGHAGQAGEQPRRVDPVPAGHPRRGYDPARVEVDGARHRQGDASQHLPARQFA